MDQANPVFVFKGYKWINAELVHANVQGFNERAFH